MISKNSVVKAGQSQISSDLGGEVAILHFEKGIYYGLDEVGARIWDLIQEPRTVSQIMQTLMAEYDVEVDRCESDLLELLEELAIEELITIDSEPSA